MKKILASLFLISSLFCSSFAQAPKDKTYYLITLDEKALNAYDKHILDSLLPLYHKSNDQIFKLKVLKNFASSLSDEKVWVPYNLLMYNMTVGKTDSLSLLFNADALNNKGYEYQYIRNKIDSAIVFYTKALELNNQIAYAPGIGTVLNNLAYIYQQQGQLEKCIELYNQAEKVFTKANYYEGLISIHINLGDVYFRNDDFSKAEESFNKALVFAKKTNQQFLLGNVYNQLAAISKHKKNYSRSFRYYLQAVNIYIAKADFDHAALVFVSLSKNYLETKDMAGAKDACEKALANVKASVDPEIKSRVFDYVAFYYLQADDFDKAKIYSDSAYFYAKKTGYPALIYNSANKLSKYYRWKKDFEKAFLFLNEATRMNDSINNDNIKKVVLRQELKADFEKKEIQLKAEQDKKDADAKAEKKQQQYILYAVILALAAMVIVVYVVYRNYASKKKSALLLEEKNKIIYTQKQEVEVKQKEIIDSINYAQKIQAAVLTSEEVWKKISPEYFIVFFPKDIVSGDFYWAHNLVNNRSVFALADCTGHGVPGGFMSMLGNSFLNELVVENKLFKADEILNKLRSKIIAALGQKGAADRKDGMDMAICVWNKLNNTLEFSGANNNLWLVRNNELTQYSGDKMPIGQFDAELKPFSSTTVSLEKNDLIVLCTDGFSDQFGGDNGKKLKSKNLKDFVLRGANKPLNEQKKDLISLFSGWKGKYEQVDDVSLIMIKVT